MSLPAGEVVELEHGKRGLAGSPPLAAGAKQRVNSLCWSTRWVRSPWTAMVGGVGADPLCQNSCKASFSLAMRRPLSQCVLPKETDHQTAEEGSILQSFVSGRLGKPSLPHEGLPASQSLAEHTCLEELLSG